MKVQLHSLAPARRLIYNTLSLLRGTKLQVCRCPLFLIDETMSSLLRLSFTAVWISEVLAKNETFVHGWEAEPQGRGTWSILWSCLATVILCTWSALHMDVPTRHGSIYLFFRRCKWMVISVMAPEIILAISGKKLFNARDLLRQAAETCDHTDWTLTHMLFAHANGFGIRQRRRNAIRDTDVETCRPIKLRQMIRDREISRPPITEDELKSRGKSDWQIKLVAVLQMFWFSFQTLFRALQHYQITALEIMTIAFVVCSVFIYGFSWYQPQDIEYPVELESSVPRPRMRQSRPATRSPNELATEYVSLIFLHVVACGFGALHLLAWNSSFPTSKERLVWRVCSIATTTLPALGVVGVYLVYSLDGSRLETLHKLARPFCYSLTCPYAIGRIGLIVLAFMALRDLPASAYLTVDWNKYIPHFST